MISGDYAIKILEWIYVNLNDIEDKTELTELETQIYNKLKTEFGETQKRFRRVDEVQASSHEPGCSGDCETLPDGKLACSVPIDEV